MTVTGLSLPSRQGDSAVVEILRRFGADVTLKGDALSVSARPLRGVTVNVGETPDLVPALAVAAVAATGQTVLENAGRLRLKESDRIATVCAAVNALGGSLKAVQNCAAAWSTQAAITASRCSEPCWRRNAGSP